MPSRENFSVLYLLIDFVRRFCASGDKYINSDAYSKTPSFCFIMPRSRQIFRFRRPVFCLPKLNFAVPANKKTRPDDCRDRINTYSCGATLLDVKSHVLFAHTLICRRLLTERLSPSYILGLRLSARPQESIRSYVFCRDLTARDSL